ncbi:MAG: hypothetical protein ACD_49C00044G0006 [uncultured bacterium (gcode 4)]|uniref:DNA polymerase III subunit gamma/tau n=1 Tax=uncultured bacterium (gcode 4) TaxID=1234023 RepID=K2BVW3_9BACT|nr:MAG: hypothetical protein ACD_49C00044G0006 [uncultured bacterium (gcode 4)]
MSLYQKYRPKDFESLIWQEFVKISLQNALIQDKTVWAYLFYWSRGTGKTSVARILARWFNCTDLTKEWNPCHKCDNCESFNSWEFIDIIEIDAASNTWVDNIRELIEKAQFQPNQAKYKIYIIDEVHMLSKWAFNALLKILEEPPSHVKFILATTEIHKIPDTIISRTQRYDFKKITENDISDRLRHISKSEDIIADEAALSLIARLSKWWLRDAISLFEQYSIWWHLKLEYLKHNLQLVWDEFLIEFSENIVTKNKDKVIKNLEFLKWKWIDVKIFIEEMVFYLRNELIANFWKNEFNTYIEIFEALQDIYSKLRFVPDTFSSLEIWILKIISDKQNNSWNIIKKESPSSVIPVQAAIYKKDISPKLEKEKKSPKNDVKEAPLEQENKKTEAINIAVLIEKIKKEAGKGFVAMTLKASKFDIDEKKCIIRTSTKFNYDKLNTPEIRHYLNAKIEELFWQNLNILIEYSEDWDLLWEALDVF